MAIAYVQAVAAVAETGSGATSWTVAVGSGAAGFTATTVGNHVILSIGTGVGVTVTSVTDSRGNGPGGTYNEDCPGFPSGTNQVESQWSAHQATALTTSDSWTITLSAAQKPEVSAAEYSGIAPASWVESTLPPGSRGGTTTAATTSGTFTLTPAASSSQPIVGLSVASGGSAPSDADGVYTERAWSGSNALFDDLNNTGTTAISGKLTWTGSVRWALAGAVYKAGSTYTDTPSGTVVSAGSAVEVQAHAATVSGTATTAGSAIDAAAHSNTATIAVRAIGTIAEGWAVTCSPSGTATVSGTVVESIRTSGFVTVADEPMWGANTSDVPAYAVTAADGSMWVVVVTDQEA